MLLGLLWEFARRNMRWSTIPKEVSAEEFLCLGERFFHLRQHSANSLTMRTRLIRFKSAFGITPGIVEHIWYCIKRHHTLPINAKPDHLLCAFLSLKCYNSESIGASLAGLDEKAYQKWTWLVISKLSALEEEVVSVVQRVFAFIAFFLFLTVAQFSFFPNVGFVGEQAQRFRMFGVGGWHRLSYI
jgi:hypothetical protein